ncbi:hypothetical protein [Psychrobacter lutiphocae]|uniref:hypothetical protein n=1 Tax=Psychrobacter lutiphocae TaxID=540500 RepID=UPI000375BB94|nr:hypothetical protein [Psychrobacter lutiphocae]
MSDINQQVRESNQLTTARRLLTVPSLMLGAALVLTACGGNEHQVKAVDKVEEAAELAKANAPEPEPLELDEVEVVAPADEAEDGDEVEATDDAEATDVEATDSEVTEEAVSVDAEASQTEDAEVATEEEKAAE